MVKIFQVFLRDLALMDGGTIDHTRFFSNMYSGTLMVTSIMRSLYRRFYTISRVVLRATTSDPNLYDSMVD